MSEIQDAAQIIKVSFEGTEVILKVGKTGWDFVKEVCAVFKRMLDQEKLSGKTSVKKLLKSGGDLQVFKFETQDMEKVKRLADKYGVLYSILPDLNKADGMSEILFHSQAAPRIQSIMEQIENSRIETMEDYLDNADPEEKQRLVDEVAKKSPVLDEKEYQMVAEEFTRNPPGTKVSTIRDRLNMTWMQIWPIIRHMESSGLGELGKDGTLTMRLTHEEFKDYLDSEQWKNLFGKEDVHRIGIETDEKKLGEIRRIHKESKDDPNINAITIDRKLVMEETERHIKTRIPYKRNEYIWLDKSEISWINENKTIYAGLNREKDYAVLDAENKPVRTVSGQKLYEQSYDPVTRNRVRQEQERKQKQERQRQHRRAQKTLSDTRKMLEGRRR